VFDNVTLPARRIEENCIDSISLWANRCKKECRKAIVDWAAANGPA
jgi:hypothetical protein